MDGVFPEVRDNVELVQGLFSKSLPPFLAGHYRKRHPRDVTFLHIDCDLYHGECSVFIHSMQSDTRACLHSAAWSLKPSFGSTAMILYDLLPDTYLALAEDKTVATICNQLWLLS